MSLPNWEKNYNSLQNKVDKVEGKGLSSNDFTNEYKNKIDNMNDLIQLKSITAQFKSLTNEDTSNTVSVQAVIPKGYKFLCWINCSSDGWVSKGIYISTFQTAATKIWTKEPVQEPRTINVYYLVIKN